MAQVLLKDNYFDITLNNKDQYDYDIMSFQFSNFKKWLDKQGEGSFIIHEVDQTEVCLLDLISYEIYGSSSYWWIIAIANNMLDPVNDVTYRRKLKIPTVSAISTYIALLTKTEQQVIEL